MKTTLRNVLHQHIKTTFCRQAMVCLFFILPIASFSSDKFRVEKLKPFIPEGYQIINIVTGDLNFDSFNDYAVILKAENEDRPNGNLRPLMIFTTSKKGTLQLVSRNDSIILPINAGGIFGDPFSSLSIKNKILSIEHSLGAGTNWSWTRTVSFSFETNLQELILVKDESSSKSVSNSYQKNQKFENEKSVLPVLFSQYSSYNGR